MVTEEQVFQALSSVRDPELPLNIVDLGLIYDVSVHDDTVAVKMTLTTPGCPMHSTIKAEAEEALRKLSGIQSVKVEIVWDPPWNTDMMSEEAKRMLRRA
jgi:metal-sulfur cluster biosynthetic enzyme